MKYIFTPARDKIIKGIISGEYFYKKDDTREWACYFFNIPTKYIIVIGEETFPISLEMIRMVNEVKVGRLKYEDGEFKR